MKFIFSFMICLTLLFGSEIKLTKQQADFIAKKVWQNEGAGLDKYLIHWNKGEDFASVGIGHFIWFPKGHTELFSFLKNTMPYQAEFMAQRLSKALPQMLNSITSDKRQILITKRFNEVMHHKNGSINEKGLYVLLDYINFKGEGTLKSERYNNQGWGLLQVLEHINPNEPNKLKAFAQSASTMLSRRIKNSPPARGEERWRKGWNIRLETYWK
ncbi:hypothetical protein LPB137_08340 [Poseidonibacter parvus]|uniref:Uncharacterized protein n=1 Tax=Poseidonibacter parvus TaxID=1850254 RepID=A0A1P8KQY6_9BACT|nr:hypothetical protein [Poseidonibacter parvus]APW66974.1 hypothetical protein LPB137_08340 [Poseidonibacter parvus]